MNEISTRLYRAMENPCLKDGRRSSNSYYPSSVSIKVTGPDGEEQTIGTCLRQQYYSKTEKGISDIGPVEYRISAMQGDKNHELIEELIDTYGFQMGMQKISAEHSIYDEVYNISGRSDLLVWDYTKNQMAGIEIKSVGDYKASKTIQEPDPVHIMQSMLYLDHYRKSIPSGQIAPERWYILYIARNESYHVKNRKHGSLFQKIWDFCIEINENGEAVVYSNNTVTVHPEYNIQAIYDRYTLLDEYVSKGELPPRDFIKDYSEEKIAGLHKAGAISRKADREKIDKWLAKGAPAGKLNLPMGDIECQFCQFKSKCWDNASTSTAEYQLPTLTTNTKQQEKKDFKL